MTDLSTTIAARSDQMNADDLMGGPREIEVTNVRGCSEPEQPIAIEFVGDEGKPFKPCKTIRRVLVAAWGPQGKDYVGRRMRLYRDDSVKFGGILVGGIRISHMSHLQNDISVAVNVTRGKKAAYLVKALRDDRSAAPKQTATAGPALPLPERVAGFVRRVEAAATAEKLTSIWAASEGLRNDIVAAGDDDLFAEMTTAFDARKAQIAGDAEEPA